MYKTILKQLAMMLIEWGFGILYNAIDKDKDGKLSKKEINEFAKYITDKIKSMKK